MRIDSNGITFEKGQVLTYMGDNLQYKVIKGFTLNQQYTFHVDSLLNAGYIEKISKMNLVGKAFAIANNAIYFDDSSDYLTALYEVCKTLNPDIDDELIGSQYIKRS